jgi:glutathione synthase/RimK-type ligase-like ATP-grasp enzyme
MGRIAIFTDDPGWHGKQLSLAFANLGYSSDFVSLTQCSFAIKPGHSPIIIPGFEQDMPDAAFVRGVPGGSLEEVVLYLDFLHALKVMGIPVYNDGYAVERSVDKGMTGSHGVYYLQRFVHCSGEGFSDNRVFVVNGRAVAAMRRRGKSWLNNVARGASCEQIKLDAQMAALAVKATEALAMDYAGVDIIQDKDGQYMIIEVNSIPAWKGLESVCDVTIAQILAEDLINRYLNAL